MPGEFKHLFEPIQIGPMTVRNRVFFPAHATRYMAFDDLPNERVFNYWLARAKGGVGLIITGAHLLAPASTGPPQGNPFLDNRVVERFKPMADAIHQQGAKVLAQFSHIGRVGSSLAAGGVTLGPSLVRRDFPPQSWEIPHEMDINEINRVVSSFAQAARMAREAGWDGVEIQGAAGHLVAQFMSPITNQRTDEYGGSLENRLRFALEIIAAVRAAVGKDYVVGFKITADEFVEGGLTLEDTKIIAQKVESTGNLTYINVVSGYANIAMHVPPMYYPPGCFVYLAAWIKEVVNLPVFTIGRINDVVQAEQILAAGHADMVGMVRAMICDPQLVNKARDGKLDDIRKCMGCEEGCYGRYRRGFPVACAFNPEAGREKEFAITPATTKKKVMVIGGGAAGLETARVAALRGHRVSLYEKEKELGGQINIALKAPRRDDFSELPRFYSRQLKSLRVEVNLGVQVTEELVKENKPDAVVVATGSLPLKADVPGADGPNVVDVRDVLLGRAEVGQNVVVVAGEHGNQGLSTADFLVDREKKVEVLTEAFYAGGDMPYGTLQTIYLRLLSKGVTITPLTGLKEIEGSTVVTSNVFTNAERRIEKVDTVVLAMGGQADDALYRSLAGKVKELYAVGQCLSPRGLYNVILDGARVGRAL